MASGPLAAFSGPDDLAKGEIGMRTVPGRVFRPHLVDVGLHLVRIGQGNIPAIVALPVREGVISELDKFLRIGIDDGGTLDMCAAANTAYDHID